MHKTKVIGLLLSLLALFPISCDNNKLTDDSQSKEIAAIDSLIATKNDQALKKINQGMHDAKDSMSWHEFYSRKATYFRLSPTPDSLLPIVNRVERFAVDKTNTERGKQLLAYAYNCHAAYYHNFHLQAKQVVELYTKSYDLLMTSHDKSQAPKVIANLGDAYTFENNLPQAAKCYRRAIYLVDSLNLPDKDNVTLYLGFAGISLQLGDYNTALKYYKQTEKQVGDMSLSMQAYFLNNFGNYYYYIHDYKQALSKFEALRHLLEKNGMKDNFDMYLCKINLADVYLNLDRLSEAKSCLDDVEPFANKHGDPAMLYYCQTIRIGIASKEKNWNEVSRLIEQEHIDGTIPFQLRHIRNRYLCDYYTSTGKYKQAYDDLLADRIFNDSLEHNRTNMRTADIIAQMTADTLRLHSDLAMEQQRASNRQLTLVAAIAITLALACVLLFTALRFRSKKRLADAFIKIMNLRLSNSRNRFSPHFVFNVLNNYIISSDVKDNTTLLRLTKFIRSGLDVSRQILVPLGDELNHMKDYVNLEKPMAGNDFVFNMSVEDGINLQETYVPSMLIQLMVENAFVHGLSGWTGHKVLTLAIKKTQKAIEVKVIDNGPGLNMQAMRSRKGHGLDIIRQTIAVLNSRNRQKIIFNIGNVTTPDGHVAGCQTTLTIPENLKDLRNITNFKPTL